MIKKRRFGFITYFSKIFYKKLSCTFKNAGQLKTYLFNLNPDTKETAA